MPSVVTANHLRSGTVVYLTHDGKWVDTLGDARVANDASALTDLEALALAAVERNDVTAVYAFDVRVVDGQPQPISVRERIRAAHAPTV
jgi:Protein of unknown function (DUF2849)